MDPSCLIAQNIPQGFAGPMKSHLPSAIGPPLSILNLRDLIFLVSLTSHLPRKLSNLCLNVCRPELNSSLPGTHLHLHFLIALQTQQTPQRRRWGSRHQLKPGTQPSHLILLSPAYKPAPRGIGICCALPTPPWALPMPLLATLSTSTRAPRAVEPCYRLFSTQQLSYLFTTFFVTHYSPLKQFSQEAACGASEAGVCRHTATFALSMRGTPVA